MMNNDIKILLDLFSKFDLDDTECISSIKAALFYIPIEKKNILFKQGTPAKYLYFLPQGIVRYYVHDFEGIEYTKVFRTGPTFLNSTYAMETGNDYPFSAEILHAKRLYRITLDFWKSLIKSNGYFVRFYQKYLADLFIQKEKRELSLLQKSPEDNYLQFQQEFKAYLSYIPQWMVASYLGITPEALCRIKKRVQRSKDKKTE